MAQGKVYVKLPKAGLGNMMLTWSRAYVFSQLNNFEMHTSSWTTIHLGALMRRERKSRLYFGYFKKAGLLKKIRFQDYLKTRKKIYEPEVEIVSGNSNDALYVFNKIFTDYDFFKEVRPYKDLVKKGIFDMLTLKLQKQFKQYKEPVIGMHIRRGDFSKGSFITPLSFFIEVITTLRREAASELPVTIFTDASPSEIKDITSLKNVAMAEPKPDILDILLLASSETIVLSVGSTFSYWAAFLSDGKIIKNEREWHVPFRAASESVLSNERVWRNDNK